MHTCGDGAVGLPIDDSKFVDEDGFTLSSTTCGEKDGKYTIHYQLTGECDDGFPHIHNMEDGKLYMELYQKFLDLKTTETSEMVYT